MLHGREAGHDATGLAAGNSATIAILLLAAIVRGAALVALFGQLQADPDAYREIAENLLVHGSYALDLPAHGASDTAGGAYKSTAYRPPLYPLLLAAVNLGGGEVSLVRVALLQWLLGLATVWLTLQVGRRLQLGWGAYVAALVVTCDPILLNQSSLVMTETLATLLAVAAIYAWLRLLETPRVTSAIALGAALGLAGLCRPTFLPWAAMLVLLLILIRHATTIDQTWRARLTLSGTVAVTVALVLSPWIVRNQLVFGKPIVTTTHGGYTLLLGNNPSYYRYLQDGKSSLPWPADDPEFQQLLPQPAPPLADELAYDATTKQLAHDAIRDQPTMFVRASLDRAAQIWSPLPHRTSENESRARTLLRYATCVWYVLVYAATIAGLVRLRGRLWSAAWLGALLLCVGFTLMHLVYWSNLRMRAPVTPVVALLAGVGVASLAGRQKLPLSGSDRLDG